MLNSEYAKPLYVYDNSVTGPDHVPQISILVEACWELWKPWK